MKIVEIHAVDWAFYDDCFTLPDDFPPIEVKIVGWLVEDTPDYVSVALEDYPKEKRQRIRHVLSIPRVCIKAIHEYDKPSGGTGFGKPGEMDPLDSVEKDAIKV